ncbi:MAG: hypothetical protein M3437_11370 [Chloroflexota bacterium]|nr:hypothetical protein [Chloroflexota bacterium]MDQ5865692.1 hypothetical protein [Chloroflexota bacterium]
MSKAQEIYANTIRDLPPEEQLRLAALILNQLTQAVQGEMDIADSWSDEDMHDLAAFSLKRMDTIYTQDEDIV